MKINCFSWQNVAFRYTLPISVSYICVFKSKMVHMEIFLNILTGKSRIVFFLYFFWGYSSAAVTWFSPTPSVLFGA